MKKIMLAVALTLCLSAECRADEDSHTFKGKGDVFYPWQEKNPEPPIATIDPVDKEDEGSAPRCVPDNLECEDP